MEKTQSVSKYKEVLAEIEPVLFEQGFKRTAVGKRKTQDYVHLEYRSSNGLSILQVTVKRFKYNESNS